MGIARTNAAYWARATCRPQKMQRYGARIVARQKQKVAQWDSLSHCISHRAALPLYPGTLGRNRARPLPAHCNTASTLTVFHFAGSSSDSDSGVFTMPAMLPVFHFPHRSMEHRGDSECRNQRVIRVVNVDRTDSWFAGRWVSLRSGPSSRDDSDGLLARASVGANKTPMPDSMDSKTRGEPDRMFKWTHPVPLYTIWLVSDDCPPRRRLRVALLTKPRDGIGRTGLDRATLVAQFAHGLSTVDPRSSCAMRISAGVNSGGR